MIKTLLITFIACVLITLFALYKLQYEPFIYLHYSPVKFNHAIQQRWQAYFTAYGIKKIAFGSVNADQFRPQEISVYTDDKTYRWTQQHTSINKVIIKIDESQKTHVYWKIPDDMDYSASLRYFEQNLIDVMKEFETHNSIKQSFEN